MTILHCDFLVIGAGMAGVSAAAALATHGRVVLVEREEHPGYHATGRSAAIFADSYGNDVVRQLSAKSRPVLEDWAGYGLLRPRGLLYLTLESSSRAAFDDLGHLPGLSPRESCGLVPILCEEAILEARWEATAADIDVAAMQAGYLKMLRERRGIVLAKAEARLARYHGGWRVDAGDTTVCAPVVVNAAGAWASEIGALFGAEQLPLVPMRRSAAIVDGPADVRVDRWPMVVDIDESISLPPSGLK
jgi:D-arginine dehydrogenase